MGDCNEYNDRTHDNADYFSRYIYNCKFIAAVFHSPIEQACKDTSDRIGSTNQCNCNPLKTILFLCRKLTDTFTHSKGLHRTAKTCKRT